MYKIILAISEDGFIADSTGNIPWYIPHDFKWFKMNTYKSSIVMGRKTWESFKNPLHHRKNIVLSRGSTSSVIQLYSVNETYDYFDNNEGWIIGGTIAENFYRKGILLYLTHVHMNVHNGTFINLPDMKTIWKSKTFSQNGYMYTFTINIII